VILKTKYFKPEIILLCSSQLKSLLVKETILKLKIIEENKKYQFKSHVSYK